MSQIYEWLNSVANKNESTVEDSSMMQGFLRNSGIFPRALVTYGIVYPEGFGASTSIQAIAQILIDEYDEQTESRG